MTEAYVTPTELLGNGEDVEGIEAESSDYVPYELLAPTDKEHGVQYFSKKRDIKVTRKVSKDNVPFLSVEISFNELENAAGETVTLSRPVRTWVNSLQFKQRNRPGTTSSLADYLTQCGFAPKELSGEQLLEALTESGTIPTEAIIGWTNQTHKTGEKTAAGKDVYTEEECKTADFNAGTKENPNYVANITKDGQDFKAKHRLVAFRRI